MNSYLWLHELLSIALGGVFGYFLFGRRTDETHTTPKAYVLKLRSHRPVLKDRFNRV
jgi:hypothetical protein